MKKIEEKVAQKLIQQGRTLCVAESCTGGLLASRLTDIPGSSAFLQCALVTYSNEAKSRLLKVPKAVLKQYGAVSFETVRCMAEGVRALFDTDFGVSLSGIAGPDGGTKTKPVGLVFLAVSTRHDTLCLKCQFSGTRTQIKQQAATQALILLEEYL